MNGTALAELREQVAKKVEKDVAQVCIDFVKRYENGDEIARDIAEKFGIDLESIETAEQLADEMRKEVK